MFRVREVYFEEALWYRVVFRVREVYFEEALCYRVVFFFPPASFDASSLIFDLFCSFEGEGVALAFGSIGLFFRVCARAFHRYHG